MSPGKRALAGLFILLSVCQMAFSIYPANTDLTQPGHSTLTQKASVSCSFSDSNLTLVFYLESHMDGISDIYFVNQTDPTDITSDYFSLSTEDILGNGTVDDPYTFSVTAYKNPSSYMVAPEDDVTKAEITDSVLGEIKVLVMVKSDKSIGQSTSDNLIIFNEDVLYTVSCNSTDAEGLVVSSDGLEVNGEIKEVPTKITETARLYFYSPIAGMEVNATNLGYRTFLVLEHTSVNDSRAIGMYMHSLDVCDAPDCNGEVTIQLVDNKGCPYSNSLSVDKYQGSDLKIEFFAFQLLKYNVLYFKTKANFCYNNEVAMCNDYCAFNSGPQRKRRDVQDGGERNEDLELSTIFMVTVDGEDNISVEQIDLINQLGAPKKTTGVAEAQDDAEKTALLGTVISLAALLLVGLAVAILIFYRATTSRKKQTVSLTHCNSYA